VVRRTCDGAQTVVLVSSVSPPSADPSGTAVPSLFGTPSGRAACPSPLRALPFLPSDRCSCHLLLLIFPAFPSLSSPEPQ